MSLLRALSAAAADRGDAVCVGDRALSWEELRASAAALAGRLDGAPAVAIRATPTAHTVVGVVAGLLAGVPVVPLPPDAAPTQRHHILRDSGAALELVTDGELSGTEDPAGMERIPIDLDARSTTTFAEPGPEAIGLIMYTSGTTGPPKGVLLSRGAIAAGLDAVADAWAWSPDDVLVHGLPLFHVHGLVLGMLGPLRVGSALTHTGRPTPAAYAAAGGTLLFGVPTVWSRVCADPAEARALSGARLLVSGSAPLPVPVFERLAALTGQAPVERYGMTETLITLSARADGPRRPGLVGTPVRDARTRLVDDDGATVTPGGCGIGELQVCAPTLFSGYLNQPEATAASWTSDGWFRTGDLATIDQDGWHRIVGRTSVDLIKSGGYRIGAGEVENALLAHPGVVEAAVVGAPDADLGQRIVAFVVAPDVRPAELTAFVSARLSRHQCPREIRFVDELPRNDMGKVQKKLLLES